MSQANRESKQPANHFVGLDWIRFLACMVVFIGHARAFHWVAWSELEPSGKNALTFLFFFVSRFGHEAVIVFFLLSGYLVGGPLVARAVDGSLSLSRYSIDRFSRIYLPLIGAWFVTALCTISSSKLPSVTEWIGNALALQGIACGPFCNNSPLWSLSYEIWFYVLGGAIAGMFSASKRLFLTSGVLFLVAMSMFMILDARYLLIWLMGGLSYTLRHPLSDYRIAIVGGCTMALGGLASQLASETSTAMIVQLRVPPFLCWFAIAMGGLMILPWLSTRQLQSSAMRRLDSLGSILAASSYTLYLLHFPLLGWVGSSMISTRRTAFNISTASEFVFKIAIVYVISLVVYFCFERRTLWVRKSLYRWCKV